jgi:hypothetical protein
MFYKLIIGLFLVSVGLTSCNDGCLKCSGITATQEVCKNDFNQKSDYEAYVSEYEENGGICE